MGQQLFRQDPPRGRPYLARGGSWNNLHRGVRQGRWQTRTRPFQQRGRAFPPSTTTQPPSEQRYVPKSFTNNICPSTSSWTPKNFSEQLASYYGRPLSIGDYCGLQNRVSFYASPSSLASHFRINSPTGGCSSRNRQNGSARSRPPSLPQHRRGTRQQYISSQQEGWWPPPGYKPKESEFLCELPTFQNGGNSYVTGPVKKGRFHGQTGLKRRILYCPGLERASKIPMVRLEGNSMGICMSPIWAGQCPPDIH